MELDPNGKIAVKSEIEKSIQEIRWGLTYNLSTEQIFFRLVQKKLCSSHSDFWLYYNAAIIMDTEYKG